MNQITYTQAVTGFLLAANARRLSPHTIRDYTTTFRKLENFLEANFAEDPPITDVTKQHITAFLASSDKVSKKTLLKLPYWPIGSLDLGERRGSR